jgi:hypothetical protein
MQKWEYAVLYRAERTWKLIPKVSGSRTGLRTWTPKRITCLGGAADIEVDDPGQVELVN